MGEGESFYTPHTDTKPQSRYLLDLQYFPQISGGAHCFTGNCQTYQHRNHLPLILSSWLTADPSSRVCSPPVDSWNKTQSTSLSLFQYMRMAVQWIPVHGGLSGNEEADNLLRTGSHLEQPKQAISYNEVKALVKHHFKWTQLLRRPDASPETPPTDHHIPPAQWRLPTACKHVSPGTVITMKTAHSRSLSTSCSSAHYTDRTVTSVSHTGKKNLWDIKDG